MVILYPENERKGVLHKMTADIFKEEVEALKKICNLLQELVEKREKNQRMLEELFQELRMKNNL